MIKFNEITAENIKLMELAFKDMLAHIGVNVDVKVFGNLIYNGNELVCMESATFNTVPAMYRGIKVDGSTLIYEDDGAENDTMKRYDLRFHLNYRFDYWKGGENGVELGEVHFMLVINKTDGTQRLWSNGLVLGRGEVRMNVEL